MRCYVVLMIAFACSLAYAASLDDTYKHRVTMDEEGKYVMHWTMDENEKTIDVAVSVQTTGWVGFGISPYTGRMPGSDIVMAWVDSQGKASLQDRYATAHALPQIDSQQDYTLVGGEETNGRTIIKFKRKFDTGDSQDLLVDRGTSRLIWAYHSQDPVDSQTFIMHERQGSRSVNLFTAFSASDFPPLPSDAQSIDVINNKVGLPNRDTVYWCSVFKMPKVEKSAHIVMMEPIIEKGHEGLVHHMLAYDCELEEDYHAVSHDCDSENMPIALQGCRGAAIVGGWAVGAGNQSYPAHVGLPLGGTSDTKYVLLEVHYDNPQMLSGLHDSSGMRFWYTYQKRQYDAATLEVGRSTSPFMVIPEQQEQWEMAAYCSEDCTRRNLPATGVKIFSVGLHTHLAGVSLTVKHYRNGKELPDIIHNPHYDFNYQEAEDLKNEVTFLPGDQLTLICRYKTKDRSTVTVGGIATTDEMCLAYLTYYPKQPMSICMSHEDYDPYLGYFRDLREAKRTPPYNNYPSNPPYAWDVIHNATIGNGKFLRQLNDLENKAAPQQYCAARNNVLLQPSNPMAIDKFTRYEVNKFLANTPAASTKPATSTPSNGATTVHLSSVLISIVILLRALF